MSWASQGRDSDKFAVLPFVTCLAIQTDRIGCKDDLSHG